MERREERGKDKVNGKGKKTEKKPLSPIPTTISLFPFGLFRLPLLIPFESQTEQQKKQKT